MRIVPAGDLDRRIMIQISRPGRDASGDEIQKWEDDYKLWSRRVPKGVGTERATEGGVLREFDLLFEVRDGAKARAIAPESHRVLYKGRIYEIVGCRPSRDRADRIDLMVAGRPDQRGSRGLDGVSGEP